MISIQDLQKLCTDRFDDAKTLFNAGRLEGAYYLCGYAVEIGLKKKICETLCWPEFPLIKKEFEKINSFKTHELEVLLHLSGVEQHVKKHFLTEWSIVNRWDPETRYSVQQKNKEDVAGMLKATEILLNNL